MPFHYLIENDMAGLDSDAANTNTIINLSVEIPIRKQ
jgi:hypothetical protein